MQLLGQDFSLGDETVPLCEQFVSLLNNKPHIDDINELRYQVFCTNPGQSSCLLPTKDALFWHICRANYQAAVWRQALSTHPLPSPVGYGWVTNVPGPGAETVLVPKWMAKPLQLHRLFLSLSAVLVPLGVASNVTVLSQI